MAEAAITRYDARQHEAGIGRMPPPPVYDFDGMRAQGRNVYGNPDECIKFMQATASNYDFNIFSATFNFGGIPHQDVIRAMRLFAKEVMPAFKDKKPLLAADAAR